MITALPVSRIRGNGELARLIRAFDWSGTPLGTLDGWSETLFITVNTMLNAPIPMQLLWGPEYICLYNDAMAPAFEQASVVTGPIRQDGVGGGMLDDRSPTGAGPAPG